MTELNELDVLVGNIRLDQRFVTLNESGGDMYSAAINHYSRFVENRREGVRPVFDIGVLPTILVDSELTQSLLTKPFTILTGGSGTGKTKLAESLARSLRNAEYFDEATNSAIIPVGADWTDNRNVLGYVNHLRP
ncbi:MAG: hypothetical protein P1U58_19915, partial [Verrucomicrobiales bacterium]|nr:hypothetical protein [Verrucomicrobiales bacterium]